MQNKSIIIAAIAGIAALLLVSRSRAAKVASFPVMAASIAPPLAPPVALPFGTAGSYDITTWAVPYMTPGIDGTAVALPFGTAGSYGY